MRCLADQMAARQKFDEVFLPDGLHRMRADVMCVRQLILSADTMTLTAFGTKLISAFLPSFTLSPSRNIGMSVLDCTATCVVLLRLMFPPSRHLPTAAVVAKRINSAAFSKLMTAASSACSDSDICSDMSGQITATTSASPFDSDEMES